MLFSSLYSRFLLFTGGQDPIFDEQLMVSEDSGFGFSTKCLTAYLVWMNFSFAERLSLSSDLLIGLLYISSSSVTRLPQAPSSLEFFPDSRNSSHTELA